MVSSWGGNPYANLEKANQVYTIPEAADVFYGLFARAAKKLAQ